MLPYAEGLIIETKLTSQRPPLAPNWPLDPFWNRQVKRSGARPTRDAYAFAPQGCIVWTGACSPHGHGTDGKRKAHRVAYERFFGPVPRGHQVHHTCNNAGCCRPDHLLAISPKVHRQISRGRAGRFRAAKVEKYREIVRLVGAGHRHVDISAKLGVSMGFISQIWNGLRNAHATADLRAKLHSEWRKNRELVRAKQNTTGKRNRRRA